MRKMVSETYYIKERELYLLLVGKGIDCWYGIHSNGKENFENIKTKEDVYRVLAGLYQKEYVNWEDEQVVLLEPMNMIVQLFQKAERCIELKKQDEDITLYYICGENIVSLEKSRWDMGSLRITMMERMDFIHEIWNKDIFSQECIEKIEFFDVNLNLDVDNYDTKAELNLVSIKDGKVISRMIVKEIGIYQYIFLYKNGRK